MDYRKEYNRWLQCVDDKELLDELRAMSEESAEDAFYRDLAFGTGGLRGIIGAGTNRMNKYVVAKASQGLSDYLASVYKNPSVVIGYDSRIKSEEFARTAASVFAYHGIVVYFWGELLPVPTVSFAVRKLGASAGVMITASHNPSKYNGYKVYGPDGCQITTEAASAIFKEIEKVDIFKVSMTGLFDDYVAQGKIKLIPESVLTDFIEEVKRQSVLFGDKADRNMTFVYSPLNGTGLIPVTRVLSETGFRSILLVEEQKDPDGHFPTCPYPNPEIKDAMNLGLSYCERTGAELLLATDPDCDRCGIAVKTSSGEFQLLSGNEVGLLLLDYICAQRLKHGKMPEHPLFVKTIVTTDLAEKIAEHYGVQTVNVLTGFKFIGEVIGKLEAQGKRDDYICGFEESYGYLTGTYVRDKDGVNAAFLICEMAAFYKAKGILLSQKLEELYSAYGFNLNTLHSYDFPGSSGMSKMSNIMRSFHGGVSEIAGSKVVKTEDYSRGLNGLPASDVLKYYIEDDGVFGSIVIRPSGTEPKLKLYISVSAGDKSKAKSVEEMWVEYIETSFIKE